MHSTECRWSGANVARNAWKVPTSYLQLDISWFNPRCPLSPPKRVHRNIFGTKASKLSIVVLEQMKLTKWNHSLFQAIPPYPSSIFIVIAFGPDHICFGRDMHVFKFNTDTGSLAFVEGVQRFDLRTSDIYCGAIPFTIPQWFLNGHVFHVAVIGSITVSASMDWDPSHILKNSKVVKLALCLWCAGLTEC